MSISVRFCACGLAPVVAWVIQDGATTCATAWPWAAAPTRCPMPWSSPRPAPPGYRGRVLRPDDSAMREIQDALQNAERSGDDLALTVARMTLGVALVHRQTAAERDRGQKLLAEVSDVFLRREHHLGELPIVNVYLARERARRGDRDGAIPLMRAAVDHLVREGQLLAWGIPATGVLVETLLDRGADGDVAEAEAAIERLAAAPADDGLVIREIWLLRLRALLARAHGDEAAYRDYRDRYRDDGDERLASRDTSRGPRRCHDGDPYLYPYWSARVPTYCPQFAHSYSTSSVISGDELPLLRRGFRPRVLGRRASSILTGGSSKNLAAPAWIRVICTRT